MQQNLKKLTNISFVYWSFAWCILKDENTNGWRDKQDVPKYKSKETCIKAGSHKHQLYLLYIPVYFENLIYIESIFYVHLITDMYFVCS